MYQNNTGNKKYWNILEIVNKRLFKFYIYALINLFTINEYNWNEVNWNALECNLMIS